MQHRNSVLVNQVQPLQHQNILSMSQAQPVTIHQPSHVDKKESSPCCKATLTFLGISCLCLITIVAVLSVLIFSPSPDDIAKYDAAVASLQQVAPSNSTSVDGLDSSGGSTETILGSNDNTTATFSSQVEGSRLNMKMEVFLPDYTNF